MDIYEESLEMHKKLKGTIEITSKVSVTTKKELSLAYTPGVAEPCRKISENVEDAYTYTNKGNTIAIVTDGSAVLGLGNIGAEASLPVMSGKSVLLKEFGDVNCVPICLRTQDENEIINIVKNIAPTFGGIMLEDIAAPRCFVIEEALQDIGIPVFHDDQHGTAIVTLAALINALKVVKKDIAEIKVVIFGAGAAALAITKLLSCIGMHKNICQPVKDIILCDSKGPIYKGRDHLNKYKEEFSLVTNHSLAKTTIEAMTEADVCIGVSVPGIITPEMVKKMNKDAIVFAMSNPTPEIMPGLAKEAGAKIIGTGRSDFPNQINNVLAFPGLFRGLLDARATKVSEDIKLKAAMALAECLENPTIDHILPSPLDKSVAKKIAEVVIEQVEKEKRN